MHNPIIRQKDKEEIKKNIKIYGHVVVLWLIPAILEPVTGGPLMKLPEYERKPIFLYIKLHKI